MSDEISLSGYSPYATLVSNACPEAVKVIRQLNIPPEVSSQAVENYYKYETEKLRTKRKTWRVFLYVYMAYNDLDNPVDPIYVANLIGMNTKEIEQAFNDSNVQIIIDPAKLSRYYINSINNNLIDTKLDIDSIQQHVKTIIETCSRKPSGKEFIENNPAKNVCVGIICFFLLDYSSLNIPKDIFEQSCCLSWACINKYRIQISEYYNS